LGDYYQVRVYQLKAEARATDLEWLAASGLAEMQGWIAGVKSLSLVRLGSDEGVLEEVGDGTRYLLVTRFASYEAYRRWRQVEAEGADFWERYASVMIHWEQLSLLVGEYAGEAVVDMFFHAFGD
jgi:heme-degrading monooxygenase HmoA